MNINYSEFVSSMYPNIVLTPEQLRFLNSNSDFMNYTKPNCWNDVLRGEQDERI